MKLSNYLLFVSLGLLINASPTQAASLSFTPTGTQKVKSGDILDFSITFNPSGSTSTPKKVEFTIDWDGNELTFEGQEKKFTIDVSDIKNTTTIATALFRVITPKKDVGGAGDFYFSSNQLFDASNNSLILSSPGRIDAAPVPEPLTILGSVTAVGFGVFLKKNSFKKQNIGKIKA
jgi:hypothetical protein